MRASNGQGSWRSVEGCGVCDGRSGEQLVDAFVVGIARVLEKDYLKQYICI